MPQAYSNPFIHAKPPSAEFYRQRDAMTILANRPSGTPLSYAPKPVPNPTWR